MPPRAQLQASEMDWIAAETETALPLKIKFILDLQIE